MAFVERKMEDEVSAQKAAFDRVLLARDPERPYSLDLFQSIFTDFIEIHGDRRYADDAAIVCGFARLDDKEVVVIGQQKGRDTNQRRHRNFAMPKPEGYRKALRVMGMAEKFNRPIITFIDTPGAYPGIDAEERGQAEAIAVNLREMARFRVPIIAVVLGEAGSGGALAIGIGDRVIMLENAIYSVISPEGCAAILWKDAAKADLAAAALKVTAKDLRDFGLVDEVVLEEKAWEIGGPENEKKGAEDAFQKIADKLKQSLKRNLSELSALDANQLTASRFRKFRNMGRWV
jgi:acetyl-CoA carboxylase carboxyl transferase subunit alpha